MERENSLCDIAEHAVLWQTAGSTVSAKKGEAQKKVNFMWLKFMDVSLLLGVAFHIPSMLLLIGPSPISQRDPLNFAGSVTAQCSFRLRLYTLRPTYEL